MKQFSIIAFIFIVYNVNGQVILNADGSGNTYQLITSVLAPGHNPIETPDCSHNAFGDHIDEVFDNELNSYVFRFHIHTTPDDDRCINFDRQRNEIKAYDKSPDNLLGIEDETVTYKWQFKLDSGFQSSPNFTHIHQLKSVGGSFSSMPMYTLTTRKNTPNRLELRYAQTNSQTTLTQTPLAPFIDTWLEVTETIKYSNSGTYEIEIKRVSDDSTLLYYSNNSIINWRLGATFVRPKWGIYRSLNNVQDLRDEIVFFANFSIEEITTSSYSTSNVIIEPIYENPVTNSLLIKNISPKINLIQLFSVDGRKIISKAIDTETQVNIDVTTIPKGIYALNFKGNSINHSKLILIY